MSEINIVKRLVLIAALLVTPWTFFYSPKAHASNPNLISFQGKVVNNTSGNVGTNVVDGSYNFVFCLYTTSSPVTPCTGSANNSAIWRESKSLTVTSGVFQTELGDTTTMIDPGANPTLYLGIIFNSDAAGEMTPLIHLDSAAYARNSDELGGLSSSAFAQLSAANAFTNANTITVVSATAFQVKNSSNAVITVDTSNNDLSLGVGSALTGALLFNNATNNNTVKIQSGTTSSTYTLTLPTALPSSTQCLQSSSSGALSFSTLSTTCGQVTLDNITAAAGTATIANTNNAIVWNWGTLTTQTGLTFGGSTAMTTGTVLALGGATYAHGVAGETGNFHTLSFTDATSAAIATSTTNGLNVASSVNVTSTTAGQKSINALNVSAPTLTACTASSTCVWDGLNVANQSTGAASAITQNGLEVAAVGIAAGTLNGVKIDNITAGAGTQTALNIGSGWNNDITAGLSATGTSISQTYLASTTQTGALVGNQIDFNTNLTAAAGNNITGLNVRTPALTSTSGTTAYTGYGIDTAGAVSNSTAGSITWNGLKFTMPNITQGSSGSTIANGLSLTTGTITTSGTINGLNIAAQGVGAGTLNGINISNITAGAGTQTALNIGSGWGAGISMSSPFVMNQIALPSVSASNTAKMYFDSTLQRVQLSVNGGNYTEIGDSAVTHLQAVCGFAATTETSAFKGSVASGCTGTGYTIPGNTIVNLPGKTYLVLLAINASTPTGGGTITYKLKYNGAALCSVASNASTTASSGAGSDAFVTAAITFDTSTRATCSLILTDTYNLTATTELLMNVPTTAQTVVTSANAVVDFTITASTSGFTFTPMNGVIEVQ